MSSGKKIGSLIVAVIGVGIVGAVVGDASFNFTALETLTLGFLGTAMAVGALVSAFRG